MTARAEQRENAMTATKTAAATKPAAASKTDRVVAMLTG